jgi:hypothetical protein
MKLNKFEWSSKMSKTINTLAVVALLATPTFASAQSIAASLSASFGSAPAASAADVADFADGSLANVTNPTSVSVAGALGTIAVATSAATADASSATSGATYDADLAPTLDVTFTASGYEANLAFTPVINAAVVAAELCANGWTASQETTFANLFNTDVEDTGGTVFGEVVDMESEVVNGAITVDCNDPV